MEEEVLSGMDNVITTMSTALSANNLWEIFGKIIPFAAVVTLFALGVYFVRRQMKKVSKAKGGV